MQTIQPFIDIGWHTVPLTGKLERLEDGSKTNPYFEKAWKDTYQKEFNENAAYIGGVITGSVSDIIAIDCDDQVTYDMFCALDPANKFHFVSKGKPKGGGTIIYKYPMQDIIPSFSINTAAMHLDFYSDEGFVYLPTDENETKESWAHINTMEEIPDIFVIPPTVQLLLYSLHVQYTLEKEKIIVVKDPSVAIQKYNYLAPQIELYLGKDKFMPSLFRIITPKDFRSLDQYIKFGYLQPDQVPEGRGSEYLSKLSAIFGADPSVGQDLYLKVMFKINSLFGSPMPRKRLISTITDPMVEGRASIAGETIWIHDEHWSEKGLTFTNKLGESLEVFFDDVRTIYYMVNYTRDTIQQFFKDTEAFSYIETVGTAPPSRKELKPMMPLVRTDTKPMLPFGFFSTDEYTRHFNLFKQTPALAILNSPEEYSRMYTRPDTIINFFESLIPNELMRDYVLGFIKRKLTRFSYSPVVLYFLGVPGSGKDTFISILANILGDAYIAKPTSKEFLEHFNGWMIDKYFIQLDEYGNQLAKVTDKQEALGKLKAYSGKDTIQIRQMRTDGFLYAHSATFVMTANNNPLMVEEGDRRIALIETPNKLENEKWVKEAGGITSVITKIDQEINDFCYYLATEVTMITADAYVSPLETDTKRTLIASKLPAAQRLAYIFNNGMFDMLDDLADEHGCREVFNNAVDGRILEADLFNLYLGMTEDKGIKRGLSKALIDQGIVKKPTTINKEKAYYYLVPGLKFFTPHQFDEIEDPQVTVNLEK